MGAAVMGGGFVSDEGEACGGDQEAEGVSEFVFHGFRQPPSGAL
jgi:hypothetical protein